MVAISGGKDSTALALRLAELEPRDYTYLITPTGDELPEMEAHWAHIETLLGKPLVRVTNGTLNSWIDHFGALPNFRQRWCTRLLKIEPCIAFLRARPGSTLYVGLRADEEERKGIYSEMVTNRFPLREWGWGLAEVKGYLRAKGIRIPERTDCARCYGQRLVEWKRLLTKYPDRYAEAEAQEERIGNTFRSPGRDTWPASLRELRQAFDEGKAVRGEPSRQMPMFGDEEGEACRVCSL